ncbi:hypothetical protein RQN30_10335 [Arcanobacterium hippocoleae]
MENNLAASYEEGLVSFVSYDEDTFAIRGMNLEEGSEVDVTTKEGEVKKVTVSEILENDKGLVTAAFTWPDEVGKALEDGQIIFTQTDNGQWLIKGYAMIEGEEVKVTSRDGKECTVIVKAIQSTDENGLQTAAFENIESDMSELLDNGRIIFIREDEDYLVKGKGLTKGSTVKVTKANGKKVKVNVGHILTDTDGVQTATFTWPNKNGK